MCDEKFREGNTRLSTLFVIGFVWCSMLFVSTQAQAGNGSEQMVHNLPSDPRAIVIQWRTKGGLAGRDEAYADLTIRADGSVTIGPRLAAGKIIEGHLTAERVQDLLSMAIDDNDFFEVDTEQVEEAVRAEMEKRKALAREENKVIAVPRGPPYLDAGTTVILIAVDGKRNEISYHGLFAAARDFPNITELGKLRAIELEMRNLAEDIVVSMRP